MWGRVRPVLRGWDPVRVENSAEKGTPDVNYVNGWIELKWERKQPRNPDRLFVIAHYSQEQRTWAIRRHRAGGNVFLLLKISQEWLLLKGEVAAEYLNYVSLNKLREVTIGRWVKHLNDQELRNLLS